MATILVNGGYLLCKKCEGIEFYATRHELATESEGHCIRCTEPSGYDMGGRPYVNTERELLDARYLKRLQQLREVQEIKKVDKRLENRRAKDVDPWERRILHVVRGD